MHGVTHGKPSSCDIFSFYNSNIPLYFKNHLQNHVNLLQLADDTVTPAWSWDSLAYKLKCIFDYSDQKYSEVNYDNTQYMNLPKSPCSAPLQVCNEIHIEHVNASDGYSWLGFNLTYSKIPNISPGLIDIRKHFFGAYIWGAYIWGAYIRRAFVLVSEYQNFEIYGYTSRL